MGRGQRFQQGSRAAVASRVGDADQTSRAGRKRTRRRRGGVPAAGACRGEAVQRASRVSAYSLEV